MKDFSLEAVRVGGRIVPAHDVTILRAPYSLELHDDIVNIRSMRRSGRPVIETLVVVLKMVTEAPLAEHVRVSLGQIEQRPQKLTSRLCTRISRCRPEQSREAARMGQYTVDSAK